MEPVTSRPSEVRLKRAEDRSNVLHGDIDRDSGEDKQRLADASRWQLAYDFVVGLKVDKRKRL